MRIQYQYIRPLEDFHTIENKELVKDEKAANLSIAMLIAELGQAFMENNKEKFVSLLKDAYDCCEYNRYEDLEAIAKMVEIME